MAESALPRSEEAEGALIGWILLHGDEAFDAISQLVDVSDFMASVNQEVFAAAARLRERGGITLIGVSEEMEKARPGSGAYNVIELSKWAHSTGVYGQTAVRAAADILIRYARARSLIALASDMANRARALEDPDAIAEDAAVALASLDRPDSAAPPDRLTTVADFVDNYSGVEEEWIIPALLRRDWRVIIVAPEGIGKSMVLRALAGWAAQGIHPFDPDRGRFTPQRSLFIDLENPDQPIYNGFRLVEDAARRWEHYDRERAWLWRRPEGINLRTRSDRRELERVLQAVRPDLVCLGPLYNAFRRERNEEDQEVVIEVQHTLSDLRTRYGFALVAEHHAPHGSGGANRDLRPFGSSAWLRWPEMGISLRPDEGTNYGVLNLARWRGDRVVATWPTALLRDPKWLWRGRYDSPDGIGDPSNPPPPGLYPPRRGLPT